MLASWKNSKIAVWHSGVAQAAFGTRAARRCVTVLFASAPRSDRGVGKAHFIRSLKTTVREEVPGAVRKVEVGSERTCVRDVWNPAPITTQTSQQGTVPLTITSRADERRSSFGDRRRGLP